MKTITKKILTPEECAKMTINELMKLMKSSRDYHFVRDEYGRINGIVEITRDHGQSNNNTA